MKKQLLSTVAIAAMMTFTACGGGGSSSDTDTVSSIQGQFIDAAVSGLTYKCSSGDTGVTDVSGHFTCNTGDSVEFSINGFVLGSATAGEIITPQTLFPNDTTAQTNLAQLLQTLDSDGNPDNGITLEPTSQGVQALSANLDVNFTQVDFDSVMTSYIGTTLVDETAANAHLTLSMQNIQNGAGEVTQYSVVAVINNASQEQCHIDPAATYGENADFTAFVNAGGSVNLEYFPSTTKSCSEYSTAGECIEQTIPVGYGGDGSCVEIVTFPSSLVTGGGDTTGSTQTATLEYMTQSEFDADLANGYIANTSFTGTQYDMTLYASDSTQKNEIWNAVTNQIKMEGTIYKVESFNSYSNAYVDFYGIEIDANQLKKPRISYTITSTSISDPRDDGYDGYGTYTMTDEYLDYGGDKFKFSKVLDSNLLTNLYPTINFTNGDEGQYVYAWDNYGLSVTLYMNESAKEKLLLDMQQSL